MFIEWFDKHKGITITGYYKSFLKSFSPLFSTNNRNFIAAK